MKISTSDIDVRPIAGGLVLAVLITMATAAVPARGHAEPEIAPDFRIDDCIQADSLVLSEFFEFPVVIFFFDAGDAACFAAYPYLVDWAKKYAADNLEVIGIHCPGYEPMKHRNNTVSAIGRTELRFPIGLDYEREVYEAYDLERLPTLVLLEPGGGIAGRTSKEAEYRAFEEGIQRLLRDIEPGVVLPFLFEPAGADGKTGRYPPPTPKMELGYLTGAIENCDSSDFDEFRRYSDPLDRDVGKVYLDGRWKVEDSLLTYEEGEAAYIRVVYSGKDVWLLPGFDLQQEVRVYVEQDRAHLEPEIWGPDIRTDISTRTFLYMRYAVPVQVLKNAAYGTHELKIIPEAGNISFHYIFFDRAR